tara:strand:+ start:657 stop:2060 length:1404 start_codon:yes stop_codon:yes gene_type:complete
MKRSVSLTLTLFTFVVVSSSGWAEQGSGRQAFDAFMKAAAGSTWVTGEGEDRQEHTHHYLLGKNIGIVDGKGGVAPFVATTGIDPETGQYTWWMKREDGSVGTTVWTMKSAGVWQLKSTLRGPAGLSEFDGIVSVVDKGTIKEQINRFVVNGEEQPAAINIWKRRPGTANKIDSRRPNQGWKEAEWQKLVGVWKAPQGDGFRIKRISKGNEIFESYDAQGKLTHKSRLDMELERHYGINFFRVSNRVTLVPEQRQETRSLGSFAWPYKIHQGKWYEQKFGIFSGNKGNPSEFFVYERVQQDAAATAAQQARTRRTTRADFQKWCALNAGRWTAQITLAIDWPGIGKKGDTSTAYFEAHMTADGNAMVAEFVGGTGSASGLIYYDSTAKTMRANFVNSGGSVGHSTIWTEDGKWIQETDIGHVDNRKGKIRRVRTFSDDGKKMMLRMTGKVGDDEIEEKTVWRRVSSP